MPSPSSARRRTAPSCLAAAVLAAIFSACAQVGADATAAPAASGHHRPGGFQNNHIEFEPKGLPALLKWRLGALIDGLPKPPARPTPVVAPDLAFIRANAIAGPAMQPAATWIGHATVLAQFGGLNLLTDPVLSGRASPFSFFGPKRQQPPGLTLAELPHIDLVLISHNHYDHLDVASVRALNAQAGGPPLFVVPLGLKAWLAGVGITRAVELDWWQSHTLTLPAGRAEIVLTPVQHWSGRGLTDRMETLWGGFAVFTPDFQLFHAGDTAYSKDFAEIRRRFAGRQSAGLPGAAGGGGAGGGFDLALLPIGAYEPRWFMATQHVDPAEALKVHADLGTKRSLGIHWGTFQLTDESLDEPPARLAEARRAASLSNDDFFVLAIGETRRFARRGER